MSEVGIGSPQGDTAVLNAHPTGTDPIRTARTLVTAAAQVAAWSYPKDALLAELPDLLALRAQVEALILDRVTEIDTRGLARERGATSTRAWLRGAHRIGPGEATRMVTLGRTLRTDLPRLSAALAAGEVSLSQAAVCAEAIGDLPADTAVAKRADAETAMIGHAAVFDPTGLQKIGRRLAELIDPDGVAARDEKPLLDKEADAHRDRELTLTPCPSGAGGRIRGRLDAAGYATLTAYLLAASSPGQPTDPSTTDDPGDPDRPADPAGPAAPTTAAARPNAGTTP